jgi:hypothetical protein
VPLSNEAGVRIAACCPPDLRRKEGIILSTVKVRDARAVISTWTLIGNMAEEIIQASRILSHGSVRTTFPYLAEAIIFKLSSEIPTWMPKVFTGFRDK